MPRYEIRYAKPPHAVGFEHITAADEFDAEIEAEAKYGDTFVSVHELRDFSRAEAHDGILRGAGRTPGWLKKIGLAVDQILDRHAR